MISKWFIPRWKTSWSTLIGRPIDQSLQLICFVFNVFGITLAQRSAEVQWISHLHSMAKWFRCERITAGQNFKNCFRQDFREDLQRWQTKKKEDISKDYIMSQLWEQLSDVVFCQVRIMSRRESSQMCVIVTFSREVEMRIALLKNNIQNEIKEDPVFQDSNTQTNRSLSSDSKSKTSFIKCPVQHT